MTNRKLDMMLSWQESPDDGTVRVQLAHNNAVCFAHDADVALNGDARKDVVNGDAMIVLHGSTGQAYLTDVGGTVKVELNDPRVLDAFKSKKDADRFILDFLRKIRCPLTLYRLRLDSYKAMQDILKHDVKDSSRDAICRRFVEYVRRPKDMPLFVAIRKFLPEQPVGPAAAKRLKALLDVLKKLNDWYSDLRDSRDSRGSR